MSMPNLSNSSSSPSVCTWWLRGFCKYGDSCTYSHEDNGGPSDTSLSPAAREKRESWRSKDHDHHHDKGGNTNGGSGTPVYTFPRSTTICRYWKAGYCRKAKGCPYRHVYNRETPVCSYWDAGDCAKGEHCRFRHDSQAKIASVDVFQVATSQQLEMALEKVNQEHERSLDNEKAAHQAREAAAQKVQHQEEALITTLERIEQYHKERRAQFEAGDHGALEVDERHYFPIEEANGDHYELWLAQETIAYEGRVAVARENHALALAGANKEYTQRLAEEAAAVEASEIAAREHQRQLQALRHEEAEITEQYAVLGESSLITCRAGIDVQSVVTGFDICRIIIKNLPRDTKHKEISDILICYGMNILDFFVSDFRVKERGNRREATVLVITNHGREIAVGLDDVDFRDHTLTFEVTPILGNVLSICWRVPPTTASDINMAEAEPERKARALNGNVYEGQRIRAEKNQLRTPLIKPTGIFGTSEDELIPKFAGTTTGNTKSMNSKSCSLEESFVILLDHLQTFPNVKTNLYNLVSEPVNGEVRIKAYFESLKDAKRAHDSLDGKQLESNSPTFHSSLPSAMQYKTIITLQQYEAQKGKWDALSMSMTGSDAKLQINKVEDRKTVHICVLGEDKKAVGLLKVRVEGMAAGERLGSHFWHPSFLAPGGKAFFEHIYKDKKVYVRIDLKVRVLRLYGESKAIEEVRQMIKEEINRLAGLETTIALDQKSIGFFMRQGLGRLQELLGEENVVLNIMPGRCEVTIKGSELEEGRHHLNRLIRESQAAQTMEQIHPEKDEKVNCPICYDEVSHPEQLGCGHIYCSGCLSHYLASAPDTKTFPLVCLGDETACKMPISLPLIRRFITPKAFQALVEAAFRLYLEQHSQELKYCPTPDCQQIYRHSPEARILQCPSCFSSICSSCDDESHEGMTCQERRNQKNTFLQERLFNEWANGNGKRCPKCRSVIEKIAGCNHMTCRCGAHFCWKCGETFEANEIYPHLNTAHNGYFD